MSSCSLQRRITWCPKQDSNLHASRHTHLKRARLPIPPLGHTSSFVKNAVSGKRDSNSRPQPWQGCALPTELFPQKEDVFMLPPKEDNLVPKTGLEPARLAAHAPETCASTNSATWAYIFFVKNAESGKRDSNSRPQPWQGCALPTELFPQISPKRTDEKVKRRRLELPRHN